MGNNLSLTQTSIKPIAGQAAFLPNQPIIHNCVVDPSATAALTPGAIVTFVSDTSLTGQIVVKQAANTDVPVGVVVFNSIKSSFGAYDKVSIFPTGSFVYLPAGSGDLTPGTVVGFNSSNQVVADTTSGHGRIGVLWTKPAASGDLVVVQLKPGTVGGSLTDYLTTADASTTYQPILTAGNFIDITSNTITTTYTAGTGIEISDAGAISAT